MVMVSKNIKNYNNSPDYSEYVDTAIEIIKHPPDFNGDDGYQILAIQ